MVVASLLFLWIGGLVEQSDLVELLRDVPVLEQVGVPGTLVVYGENAFTVVADQDPGNAIVAAARCDRGRVFAFAHDGYLQAPTPQLLETGRGQLLDNAVAWLTAGKSPLRVGVIGSDASWTDALQSRGHEVRPNISADDLPSLDLVIWRGPGNDPALLAALPASLRAGVGLLCAVCPWGWQQIHDKGGRELREDLPQNRVLREFGLAFALGYSRAPAESRFEINPVQATRVHAGEAFDAIVTDQPESWQRSYLVEKAIPALHRSDPLLLPRLAAQLGSLAPDQAPTPDRPLRREHALARLQVAWLTRNWLDPEITQVSKAPGIDRILGAVPADAERITQKVKLSAAARGWQGIGLYLPPGETLTISTATVDGWSVRIGCHQDRLWHKGTWKRWPEISLQRPLQSPQTTVASPFGGTVYLEADRADRGELVAKVAGAVAAPRYVLSDAASARRWTKQRSLPGPWAELEGRHLILSVPSNVVRDLDRPAALLRWWDDVLRSHCQLAMTDLPERRERFVSDVQISAGYMHSGYPIMTHLDMVEPRADAQPPVLLDLKTLSTEGNWGLLHELGHNRQKGEWTFSGTGEVTCNLFSLYSSETQAGIPPWDHPWLEGQKREAWKYLQRGADFSVWQSKPGIALVSYAQVQRKFGWQPFQSVLAQYEGLEAAHKPRTDSDKIDQWVLRLSLACKRDLRAFYLQWGWPLGEELLQNEELATLREWHPDHEDLRR